MQIRVGIIGYSSSDFDEDFASEVMEKAFDTFDKFDPTIVSGLTAVGIPLLAYRKAAERDWPTVGIACSKAYEYDLWPVDKQIIFGGDWGEESNLFLKSIDCLLKFGGGDQSKREFKLFRERYPDKIAREFDI